MTVDEPVYRVTLGANPAVIRGKEGVLAPSTGERRRSRCCWHSDDRLSVADWGICDELTFHVLARGADLQAIGYETCDRPDALWHTASRQAFIWPYDSRARLAGEHLDEDKTSIEIEEVSPEEAISPGSGLARSTGSSSPSSRRSAARFWLLAAGAWIAT